MTKALATLAEFQLAVCVNPLGRPKRWVKGPADLSEVADRLGAKELAEERRAKHQKEREEWAEQLAQMESQGVPIPDDLPDVVNRLSLMP